MQERGQRYYEPQNGRWLSRDPIGEKGFLVAFAFTAPQIGLGRNPYVFVSNRVLALIDILGLEEAPQKLCFVYIWIGHTLTGDSIVKNLKKGKFPKNRCVRHAFYGCVIDQEIVKKGLVKGLIVEKQPSIPNKIGVGFGISKNGPSGWQAWAGDTGVYKEDTDMNWEQFNIALFQAVLNAAIAEAKKMAENPCFGDPCACDCDAVRIEVKNFAGFKEAFFEKVQALANDVEANAAKYTYPINKSGTCKKIPSQ